jgi:hypothetical protein
MAVDPPFRLVDIDEHHVKATAFEMILIVWKKQTQASAYEGLIELVREMGERHPEGIGVLQVVEVTAIPPDDAARRVFRDALGACDKYVRDYSVVHEGAGFKSAAVRAIVMGVFLVRQPKFRYLVANSLHQAAIWHEAANRRAGNVTTAAHIERSIAFMREAVSAHA